MFRAHISVPYYAELILVTRRLVAGSDRAVICEVLVESGFAWEAMCFKRIITVHVLDASISPSCFDQYRSSSRMMCMLIFVL